MCAPNRDQQTARATTTDTKWGRITPKTHQNRGYASQNPPKQGKNSPKQGKNPPKQGKNPPKQGKNPPNQGQSLPKTGYLQIGTTPATHTVRCDADATPKAWTNIPPDVSGGHDRLFSNDPVCRMRPRRWRWGTDPGWQISHALGPQTSQTFIPR